MELITDPGKFEGLPTCLVHFHEFVLDCGSDHYIVDKDVPIDGFVVNDDDIAKYPYLSNYYGVAVWEDDQGFVRHKFFKTKVNYQKVFGG